mmetsp:Transcript_23734/g.48880  ORF Transcript_23734/g.48880 Transcript_23734/m.48880 type:complete len:378 (-) Transcript_23734:914-2047(-)
MSSLGSQMKSLLGGMGMVIAPSGNSGCGGNINASNPYTGAATSTLNGGGIGHNGINATGGGGSHVHSSNHPYTYAPASTSTGPLGIVLHGKDGGRWIKFSTNSYTDAMRAHAALQTYAFPGRRNMGYFCLRLRVGGRRSWRGASEAEAEVMVKAVEDRDKVRDRDSNRQVQRAGKKREEPWWRQRLLTREGGLCPWKNSSGRVWFFLEGMGTTQHLVVTSCRRHLLGCQYSVPLPITASVPHIHRYWSVPAASSEADPARTAEIPIPTKPTASPTMASASCDDARHSDPKIDFPPSRGAVPTTEGAFGDVPNPKSDCRGIAASKTNSTCMPMPMRPSEPTSRRMRIWWGELAGGPRGKIVLRRSFCVCSAGGTMSRI